MAPSATSDIDLIPCSGKTSTSATYRKTSAGAPSTRIEQEFNRAVRRAALLTLDLEDLGAG
jgi:hypothetical protein